MKEEKKEVKKEKKQREGIPCSPESLAEWEQSFKDMKESISNLYKVSK